MMDFVHGRFYLLDDEQRDINSLPACFAMFSGILVVGGVVSLLLQEERIPQLEQI